MSLPRVPRSRPRPKLRAIPRRKTEAAVYAEIQQLTVEKQRLQQELIAIQERRSQIETRLQEIDQNVAQLRNTADQYAEAVDPLPSPSGTAPLFPSFEPLTIEY